MVWVEVITKSPKQLLRSIDEGRKRGKWDKYHVEYNKAVGEVVDDYLKRNNAKPEIMTEAQARDLHKQILESGDERIRTYNKRMMIREIRIHILRRFGRE